MRSEDMIDEDIRHTYIHTYIHTGIAHKVGTH